MNPDIEARFDIFEHKNFALNLRQTLIDVAYELDLCLLESLKWNQPSYLSPTGSAVRIAEQKGKVGLFVHCQTSIIETLKGEYPDECYDETRGLLLEPDGEIPIAAMRLLHIAFTYKIKSQANKDKRHPRPIAQ